MQPLVVMAFFHFLTLLHTVSHFVRCQSLKPFDEVCWNFKLQQRVVAIIKRSRTFSIFKTTAYISAAFMKVSYMDRVLQVGLFDGCRLQAYNDDGGNLIATRRKSQAQSYLYTNNTRTVKLLERDAEKQWFWTFSQFNIMQMETWVVFFCIHMNISIFYFWNS